MKPVIYSAVLATSLFLGVGVFNSTPSSSQQVFYSEEKEYKTFTYTITVVNGQDYYGENVRASGYPNIYFTQEYIKSGQSLEVGDKITAVFEADNTEDGLIEIIKAEVLDTK